MVSQAEKGPEHPFEKKTGYARKTVYIGLFGLDYFIINNK